MNSFLPSIQTCLINVAAYCSDKEAGLRTLLVALPSFADSGIAVLVNVRTLAASPVNFGFD